MAKSWATLETFGLPLIPTTGHTAENPSPLWGIEPGVAALTVKNTNKLLHRDLGNNFVRMLPIVPTCFTQSDIHCTYCIPTI